MLFKLYDLQESKSIYRKYEKFKVSTSVGSNLKKPNLEPTEPPVCSWKPNLEPTEPPKNRNEPPNLT